MAADDTLAELQLHIGHSFADPLLLQQALRHRSAGSPDNERLEFLGDALLDVIVSEYLYHAHPAAPEGALTTARASLVRGDTLARLAAKWHLPQVIVLGMGERGGEIRASILAGAVEAIIGAVYLDSGFSGARAAILALLHDELAAVQPGECQKDAKTRLQELTQGRQLGLPVYSVCATSGPAHQRCFRVSCNVQGIEGSTGGEAASRREAEQLAAAAMLDIMLDVAQGDND
ncbi:MAG: ribonuclease III [Pseudomonadales bacterium]